MIHKIERENLGEMKCGQDLVVAGYVGLSGTKKILEKKQEELLQWFNKDFLEEGQDAWLEEEKSLEFFQKFGVLECEPCQNGGILKTIWDLSGAYGVGVTVLLSKIPMKQITVEVCERFQITPFRLESIGSYLLVTSSGNQLVERLNESGIPASVVGFVTDRKARVIINGDGESFLERPRKDELKKIL